MAAKLAIMAAAAAAADGPSSPPFDFLIQALFTPAKNAVLFLQLLLLITATYAGLLAGNLLLVRPVITTVSADYRSLAAADHGSSDYAALLAVALADAKKLALYGGVYTVATLAAISALRIIALVAAAMTFSGEKATLSDVISRSLEQFRGTARTLIVVYLQELGSTIIVLLIYTIFYSISFDFIVSVFFTFTVFASPYIFLLYFLFLGALTTAVSVSEPGGRGGDHLIQRTWDLADGRHGRWILLSLVAAALALAVSPAYFAVVDCTAAWPVAALLGLLYALLLGFVELLVHTAVTAFYVDLRNGEAQRAQLLADAALVCIEDD